ncbi:hypothetical protein MUN82_02450 [Hymenobacter aerilatus]|uniref:Uncharacterized protein n=1 Tax=Hymenobacter aerilatus TaxID=2932251 RepID=A0A8T9SZ43_9BACT|nr:hypothetical protein [Hymenobacter aerilatus]UOR05973.1 hypothetical protein MUN82_02450 [Hymenobacter aerilatus]
MSTGSDSFTEKTDDALRFLASHPSFYHSDIVRAAQQELRRRGLRLPEIAEGATSAPLLEYAPEPERSTLSRGLLLGGGLVAALLLGVWALQSTGADAEDVSVSTQRPTSLPASVVEQPATNDDMMPSFEALAQERVREASATVPATEWRDSIARNNYQQMVARYWTAEYQTAWLLTRTSQRPTPDLTLLGKINLVQDQWRRLTHAAAYDLKLKPVMQQRLEAMLLGHKRRNAVLGLLTYSFHGRDSLITREIQQGDTAAYAVRYQVLASPLPKQLPLLPLRAIPEVVRSQTVPTRYPNTNPLYLLHNRVFASDPLSNALPHPVTELSDAEIDSVLILRPRVAMQAYGPRAHDGAVLIFTHPPRP